MRWLVNKTFRFGTLLFTTLLLCNVAFASFNKSLWPKWEVTNPLSQEVISHQEWKTFLNTRVMTNDEGINLIDYPNLTDEDIKLLNQYISKMSAININQYNRREQLAYWLNLYNALTMITVAKYYPVESIQEINISPGLFSIGPRGANIITVNGTQLTLEDIHSRIIRPIWNDPRTHYALNNGSIGAANIGKEPFKGVTIEDQLNLAAKEYINSLRGAQVIDDKLILSRLYDWFKEDFGGEDRDVVLHLKQFASESLLQKLNQVNKISVYNYNWHLNTTLGVS